MPTLVDVLRQHARNQPDEVAVVFPAVGDGAESGLTFAELDRRARAVAAKLQHCVAPGERALLPLETEAAFLAAFLGCLYAGVVAVPTALEASRAAAGPRLQAILRDAQVSAVLASDEARQRLAPELSGTAASPLTWLNPDSPASTGPEAEWRPPVVAGGSLALLQYTSGSTGTPRGVMVNHDNLLFDLQTIQQLLGYAPGTPIVNWMPLFHDGGLILMALASLFSRGRLILVSPVAFIRNPLGWLRLISHYGAYSTVGPNFAYDLCARRATPEQCAGLDLRSLRCAMNGSEPIHAATLDRFCRAFAPYGFRPEAFTPNYGLAEATILASSNIVAERPTVLDFDARSLDGGLVVPVAPGAPGGRALVGCGPACPGLRVAIVDPEFSREMAPDRVGEIWLAGPGVAQGYWNQPEASARTFQAGLSDCGEGPFLRTGDLGFVYRGELFVAGRIKDVVIIHGQNHYPQDIEAAAGESSPSLRPGGGAAFSIPGDDGERLVVLHEVRPECRETLDGETVVRAIRRQLSEQLGLAVYAVGLVAPKSLPKTTSGKIQRFACRAAFLENRLDTWAAWVEKADSAAAAGVPGEPGSRGRAPLAALLSDPVRLEAALVSLAAEVLSEPTLQAGDNFFHVGGDSLMASRFILAVEERVGVPVAEAFLENPTVADLVRRIAPSRKDAAAASAGPGPSGGGTSWPRRTPPERPPKVGWTLKGPVFRNRLLPYGVGFYLQRAWAAVPGVRQVLCRPGVAAVRQWGELVGETRPARAVRQSLLTNTWVHWRHRVLSRPLNSSPWLQVKGDSALLRPKADGPGQILLLLHSPLSGLFWRCLAAEGRKLAFIRSHDEDKSTQQQNRSMQVYCAYTTLQNGGLVIIYGDGGKGRQGVVVSFFGAPRNFRLGAGELAAGTGASIIPVFCTMERNGRVVFDICPPLAAEGESPLERATALTQSYADLVIDRWPRVYPFQSWSNLERLLYKRSMGYP